MSLFEFEIQEQNSIAPSMNIEGIIECTSDIKFNGDLKGEIVFKGKGQNATLIVLGEARVEGTLRFPNIEVFGTIIGDVYAEKRLAIHHSGRIQGNIESEKLKIFPGGTVDSGRIETRSEAR